MKHRPSPYLSGDVVLYNPYWNSIRLIAWNIDSWLLSVPRFSYDHLHLIHVKHYKYKDFEMSRKPAKKAPVKQSEFEFIGFVNITLSDSEIAEVDEALLKDTTETFSERLEYLLDFGKVSFNYQKGSMNCSLTVMEGISTGYAVSAFGENVYDAIAFLQLKVVRYLDKFKDIYEKGGQQRRG